MQCVFLPSRKGSSPCFKGARAREPEILIEAKLKNFIMSALRELYDIDTTETTKKFNLI